LNNDAIIIKCNKAGLNFHYFFGNNASMIRCHERLGEAFFIGIPSILVFYNLKD